MRSAVILEFERGESNSLLQLHVLTLGCQLPHHQIPKIGATLAQVRAAQREIPQKRGLERQANLHDPDAIAMRGHSDCYGVL